MKPIKTVQVLSALFLLILPLKAQRQFDALKNLMRTAESLSKQKQCGKALPLYLKVFNSGPVTPILINRINRCYREQGNPAEWLVFLKRVIRRFPTNYSYKIDLGNAYFLNKQTTRALQTWQQVYLHRPPELMRYTLVARAMTSFRLFDDAAQTYKTALKTFPKQYNIYMQLAQIYRYQLDYENAVKTYMAYFVHKPKQASYVSAMLLSLARDDEAIGRIIAQLRLEPAAQNPAVQEMIAGLYMSKKDFARAFDIYASIEQGAGTNKLSYMRHFAYQAGRAKQFDWSIKAYRFLLKGLSPVRAASLNYKLAAAYYQRARGQRDIEQKNRDVDRARAILNRLIKSKLSQQYRAAELAGDIQKDYFNDIDHAVQLYTSIPFHLVGKNNADRIRMKIAACYFIKNDLKTAKQNYAAIQGAQMRHQSAWQLAEILFFNGQFKKAEKAYDRILSQITMQDTLANNILERKFEITAFSTDSTALAEYAAALRLGRQRKQSEAAKKLQHIFKQNGELSATAGIKAARIYLDLEQPGDAEAILNKLTAKTDDDDAFWLLGQAYEKQNLPQKALGTYQRLLQKYPNGFHSERAREAARNISGLLKENPNG